MSVRLRVVLGLSIVLVFAAAALHPLAWRKGKPFAQPRRVTPAKQGSDWGWDYAMKVYDVAGFAVYCNDDGEAVPDYEQLGKAVVECGEAFSWDAFGGPGHVEAYDYGGIHALVVWQTYHNHKRVAELLAKLREVRNEDLRHKDLQNLKPLPPSRPKHPRSGADRVERREFGGQRPTGVF